MDNKKYLGVGLLFLIVVVALGAFFYSSSLDNNQDSISNATSIPDVNSKTLKESEALETSSPISPVAIVSPLGSEANPTAINPNTIQTMLEEAVQLQERGEFEEALVKTNQIIELDPNNFFAFNIRGSVYLTLSEFDKAIEDYNKTLDLEPFFPHAFYNRGRAFRLKGQDEQALEDLQKSIDLSPTEFSYRAYGNIGLIHYKNKDYNKALVAFENSINNNTEDKADIYFFRGETYTSLENFDAAISDYQAAIERFNNYAQAYQGLGFAYYKIGDIEEARQAIEKAVDISPDSSIAYFYLGLINLEGSQVDLAKENFSTATKTVDSLSAEDKDLIHERLSVELERFAQENPNQSQNIEMLLELLP